MIEAKGLSKSFGLFSAVKEISFNINKGEIVGLLGPNGAGKTTTMRMLTGFYEPSRGQVKIKGMNIDDSRREVQSLIGYLPESASSYHDMLVCDFLEFIGSARSLSDEQLKRGVDFAVSSTSLEKYFTRPIGQLSKGYKQRVGLAAALIHDPEVLILDEPTSGLDPNQIVEIQNLISELAKEKTIILSTHILKEVEETCKRVLIIADGRLVLDESLLALQGRRDGAIRLNATIESDNDPIGALSEKIQFLNPGSSRAEGKRHHISFATDDGEEPAKVFHECVARGWVLTELHREKKSLEEVFQQLTGVAKSAEG
ncbi:MAG: ATP-binding cassette domain-containing protein [Leptospiraceae bacterium]|nr:ATP-binding cassette domain-containing protein [Leptospiraceae bacterium]